MYIMKRIDVGSWAEFELELDKLRGNLDEHASPLLFRGQPNSQWRLRTTLERHGGEGRRFSEYYRLMTRVKPDVETLTRISVHDLSSASWIPLAASRLVTVTICSRLFRSERTAPVCREEI